MTTQTSTHFDDTLRQIQTAHRIYSLHPDPLLKSAIAHLGGALASDHLSPQQARISHYVDTMATAAATLYDDPSYLPPDIQEEW